MPVDQSPIRFRPINGSATWVNWVNWFDCDAVIPDPDNLAGPDLCELDISNNNRAVTVEFR